MKKRSVGIGTALNVPHIMALIMSLQPHMFSAQRRRLSSILAPCGVPLVRGPRPIPGAREIDADAAVDTKVTNIITTIVIAAIVASPLHIAITVSISPVEASPPSTAVASVRLPVTAAVVAVAAPSATIIGITIEITVPAELVTVAAAVIGITGVTTAAIQLTSTAFMMWPAITVIPAIIITTPSPCIHSVRGGWPLTWPVTPLVAVAVASGVVPIPASTSDGVDGEIMAWDEWWSAAMTTFPHLAITAHQVTIMLMLPTTLPFISSDPLHTHGEVSILVDVLLMGDVAPTLLPMVMTMNSHTHSSGGRGLSSGRPLRACHTFTHSPPLPTVGVDEAA